MALPAQLQSSVSATAAIAVAELLNEGKSAANDAEARPFARISERLDGRTCGLCAAVDGKVVRVGSREYARWRQPSHINCRRVMEYLTAEEAAGLPELEEPDPALVEKHGHYHLRPDRYAELRMPATPEGRQFIVRRVRHAATSEVRTVLEWAPWWEQVPQWKRDLVLKVRGERDGDQLEELLAELGITNVNDAEQMRQATLLGLRDRLEGWVTVEETPLERKLGFIERKVAKRERERAWIITPEGDTVYRKTSKSTRGREVTFRPDEQAHFRGNIFIHNHPGGTSFSPADVQIASISGAIEFRVVTREHRFILRGPEGGWPNGWWETFQVADRYEFVRSGVRAELKELVEAGMMTLDQANLVIDHEVWTRLAQELGFFYDREQR